MAMRLRDILSGIKDARVAGRGDMAVAAVTDDSRAVAKGGLFIAKRGYAQDGERYIDAAVRAGARVVVAESEPDLPAGVTRVRTGDTRAAIPIIADNFYGHPSRKLKTVGVTGTNGKTTITYLLEGIIRAAGAETGVIGTINHRMKGEILPAKNTTPGPLELQALLAAMAAKRIRYAVMEVSSHALDQGRVDRVLFDVAVFTNLTGDHLDYHKTMAKYFKAKSRIFANLKSRGTAVLNGDDTKVVSLKRSIRRKVLVYGIASKNADVRAEDIRLSMDGTLFTARTPKGAFEVRTKLVGMHNVSNILAAIAAALALGIPKSAIVKGIARVPAVPGRLEPVDAGQPFKVLVDFAHTEDALLNILNLLREVSRNRIVTVFGCGGNRDRTKRPLMGRVACRLSDHVIITSDNPRFEEPEFIIEEIVRGVRGVFSNYETIVDRREAIVRAFRRAERGDVVVIAGKGHESCQIIKERTLPFDDRDVARSALKEQRL